VLFRCEPLVTEGNRECPAASSAVPEYVKCVADRASCHWHYFLMWYVEKRLSQHQIADPAGHARRFGGEFAAVSAGLS
jgi:hypothetical protein